MLRFVFTFLTVVAFAFAYIPKFQNSIVYKPILTTDEDKLSTTYTDDKPLGFSRDILPYHGNINVQANLTNPVIEIKTDLDDTYIEIKAETQVNGARICFADNSIGNGGSDCASGKLKNCYMPASRNLKIEFYCDEGCDSNNVNIFYRVVKSPVNAGDLWCTNRGDSGWPSDLIAGPDVLPTGKTTPKRDDEDSAGHVINSSYLLISTLTLFLYIF